MADTDDLYGDLYGAGETAVDTEKADNQGEDLSAYDEGASVKKDEGNATVIGNTKSSFIPPKANTQSSFIPPSTSSSSTNNNNNNNNNNSFIPPSMSTNTSANTTGNTNAGFSRAQIQTAPMTNTDNDRSTMADGSSMTLMQQNALRPILPHEMPDEG